MPGRAPCRLCSLDFAKKHMEISTIATCVHSHTHTHRSQDKRTILLLVYIAVTGEAILLTSNATIASAHKLGTQPSGKPTSSFVSMAFSRNESGRQHPSRQCNCRRGPVVFGLAPNEPKFIVFEEHALAQSAERRFRKKRAFYVELRRHAVSG